MISLADILISIFLTFLISTGLTWLVRLYALRQSILDIPNERSSHCVPTPRGGGIAIVLTFISCVVWLGASKQIDIHLVWALVGGGLAIALIGYCDDIFTIKARWRFLMHFLVALWTIFWLGNANIFDVNTKNFYIQNCLTLITLIGIIWCINFYNFMDGIDGLASGEGLFVAIASGIALTMTGENHLSHIMWLLAAAIAGFAVWNWPPAKIFMGDVGSGFLGFVFAALGLYSINHKILSITFWWIILAVFLCDATFTLIYRIYQGKKWYSAHREHAYQHATIYGATHKKVSVSIILFNCCILMPLAFATLCWPTYSFWLLGSTILGLWLVWAWIKSLPLSA